MNKQAGGTLAGFLIGLLVGLGAEAVEPAAAYALYPSPEAESNLVAGLTKGVEKVMSTMGIHELRGYGQIFAALGLSRDLLAELGVRGFWGGEVSGQQRGYSLKALGATLRRRLEKYQANSEIMDRDQRFNPRVFKAAFSLANGEIDASDYQARIRALETEMPLAARQLLEFRTPGDAENIDPDSVDLAIGGHSLPFVISAMSFGSQGETAFRSYVEAAKKLNMMAMNGEAEQPPLKFGVAVVDLFTGMYAAQAVLAALFERQRTGQGRHVEMALFDCGLMVTAYFGLEALLLEKDPPRYGNAHPSIVPYGVFDAADGPLVITVGNNSQFDRFCRDVIERPDLADDARYKTNVLRTAHRTELMPLLQAELRARPRALLLQRLAAAGIPCGEVLGLHQALTSERAVRGGLVTRQPHAEAGAVDVLAPPYRLNGERLPVRRGPPPLGEGTPDVLRDLLGLDDAELQRLRAAAVV